MTREEKLHWLNVEIQTWENDCQSKHPIKEALYAARKALEQEPSKGKPYIQAIYTEALEEGIRCAMCTNTIKSDTGCDGGCIVDTKMYNKVMTEINSRLLRQPPVTPQEPSWIPVTERLPEVEEATRCLVTVENCKIYDYTAIRRYFPDTKDFDDTVTAWMPLPKPYTGGEE